ncbi:putative metal-binding motif-containing protein [Pyxidicoccus parkwayensis]|uniref:Metal-binding motif-containing protein n=1 Tax=Pyxidicoccus parkwayensis TaxID=2813578 RepID=A0ABX7NX90_9BACT|nr:putative metal-binding motif-containing protein [Pyxidicoccus parkwaysis]QSQ23502.1 putative metal-binding motif-containing protein [Pyxidicoccus parkwaysis]
MKRVGVLGLGLGLGLAFITCTVPDIEELEEESPSGCNADHPCDVRVLLTYDGFRPGCVTLRLVDVEDPSRTLELPVDPPAAEASGRRETGFVRRSGWSSTVKVTASAREQSCTGQVVASATADKVLIPDEGTADVALTLSATDEDGDGYVSEDSGGSDCDDHVASISKGMAERCDFLDNDCDHTVDPAPVCNGVEWRTALFLEASSFRDVAPHARGRAWFVSENDNVVAYVHREADGGVQVQRFTDCLGGWSTAWARPSDGRVFMGSWEGRLATRTTVASEPCSRAAFDGGSAAIQDIVGFEQDGGTTLYAVNEAGDVVRWDYPAPPVRVAHVDADLRSIHGTEPKTLLTVGYAVNGDVSTAYPVAYRPNPDGGAWLQESLPPPSAGQHALHSVHVVSPALAYAAGDQGLLLEREGGVWRAKPSYPIYVDGGVSPDIFDVVAFGRTAVFARLSSDDLVRFDGEQWRDFLFGTQGFTTLEGLTSDELWSATQDGTGFHWGP